MRIIAENDVVVGDGHDVGASEGVLVYSDQVVLSVPVELPGSEQRDKSGIEQADCKASCDVDLLKLASTKGGTLESRCDRSPGSERKRLRRWHRCDAPMAYTCPH